MKTNLSSLVTLALYIVAILAAQSANAANTALFWDADGAGSGTGGTGTWDTSSSLWHLGSAGGTLQAYPTADLIVTANLAATAGTVTIANSTAIQVNNLAIAVTGYTIAGGTGASLILTSGAGVDSGTAIPQIAAPNTGTATVSALITGTLGMQKGGTGTLILSGANTYTGNTAIRGGVLSVSSIGTTGSASSSLGAGTSTILMSTASASATLLYTGGGETTDRVVTTTASTAVAPSIIQNDGSGALNFTGSFSSPSTGARAFGLQGSNGGTLSGNISNGSATSVALSKAGAGTWALSGANNTYTGGTTVSAGTLLINSSNSNATGAVAVDGGTLGGNGTVGGDITVANSATAILAPGTALDSTETLTLNSKNLTFSGTDSRLNLDVTGTSAGSFDKVVGINALTANGDITFTLAGTYGTASWDVLDFTSISTNFDSVSLTGSYAGSLTRSAQTWTGTVGGQSWTFEQTTGLLSVVPEPEMGTLFALAIAMLTTQRRRLKLR